MVEKVKIHQNQHGQKYTLWKVSRILANDIKNSPSLLTFKTRLMRLFNCKALLINNDIDRNTQVAFMQIRRGFSNLIFDLYSKACLNDPTCSCVSGNEDARHYFLRCPNYDIIRQTLVTNISSQLNLVATLMYFS